MKKRKKQAIKELIKGFAEELEEILIGKEETPTVEELDFDEWVKKTIEEVAEEEDNKKPFQPLPYINKRDDKWPKRGGPTVTWDDVVDTMKKSPINPCNMPYVKSQVTSDDGIKADARGTITVGRDVTKKVNWSPGETVWAHAFSDKVVLAKDDSLRDRAHKTALYTITKSGGVRVTNSILKEAGLKDSFKVRPFKNSVQIQ